MNTRNTSRALSNGWPVGHSEWKSGWYVLDTRWRWYYIFTLLSDWWIVGRIGKLGRDVLKSLIIKSFDNQPVSLPWLSRMSVTSENQPERLDSDNQINRSSLICVLGWTQQQVPLIHYPSSQKGSDFVYTDWILAIIITSILLPKQILEAVFLLFCIPPPLSTPHAPVVFIFSYWQSVQWRSYCSMTAAVVIEQGFENFFGSPFHFFARLDQPSFSFILGGVSVSVSVCLSVRNDISSSSSSLSCPSQYIQWMSLLKHIRTATENKKRDSKPHALTYSLDGYFTRCLNASLSAYICADSWNNSDMRKSHGYGAKVTYS